MVRSMTYRRFVLLPALGLIAAACEDPASTIPSMAFANAMTPVEMRESAGAPASTPPPRASAAGGRTASLAPTETARAGSPAAPTAPVAGKPAAADGALINPGSAPWLPVPEDEVQDVCKLDPERLRSAMPPDGASFGVIRYGKLCFMSGDKGADGTAVSPTFSVTKTLGALLTGMVMYQTRGLPASREPKQGPLLELDRVDKWLEDFDVNPDALMVHLLSMTAKNEDLSYGKKRHIYDVTVDRLVDVLNVVVKRDAALGPDLVTAGQRMLATLGMQHSKWPVKSFVISWDASLHDMARLGLLLLNGGVWNGERLATAQYVYNLAHPVFEDDATLARYGYLTWLGHKCAPSPLHRKYPHGISEAPDCRLPGGCKQQHDVGVFFAGGLGGQFVVVHRALDLVIVGKQWGEGKIDLLWDAVRPAVVAADPMFAGDDAAFCKAYAAGAYAPDLKLWEGDL